MNTNFTEIGNEFLNHIDQYIYTNLKSLRCNEICDFYWTFENQLKSLRSTAAGFTGLSELLLFRCMYHYLGGNFAPEPITNDLQIFRRDNLYIGQAIPVPLDGKMKYPDIVVKNNEKLMSVLQVKAYLTNGVKELEKEFASLDKWANETENFQGSLAIYWIPEMSKCRKVLLDKTKDNTWFRFSILHDDPNRIVDVFRNLIGEVNRFSQLSPAHSAQPPTT